MVETIQVRVVVYKFDNEKNARGANNFECVVSGTYACPSSAVSSRAFSSVPSVAQTAPPDSRENYSLGCLQGSQLVAHDV